MLKHTIGQKAAGELAVRCLSRKAQDFYSGSDGITVWESWVCGEDDTPLYDVDLWGGEYTALSLDQLEKLFEGMADSMEDEECGE